MPDIQRYFSVVVAFQIFFCFSVTSSQTFTKITDGPVSNEGGDSRSVNWIDYDNDGMLDLFITNGPKSPTVNFLYHNNGDGTFTRVYNVSVVKDSGSFDGSTWADYDNDGHIDAYNVTWYGQKNSFHRQFNGMFEKITRGSIANNFTYSETASWGDYDNDGYVDLYIANSAGNNLNDLYRNNGDGTFTKITLGPLVTEVGTTRSVHWFDYDNDGDLDLFITREGGEKNALYRNDGNGVFTSIANGAIVNDGGNSFGSSVGDINNDGNLDVFVANSGNENNFLYLNNGDGTFTKITSGPVVDDKGYSVGSAFGDIDNDGNLDLIVTNAFGSSYLHNYLYLNNGDGTFTKATGNAFTSDSGWFYGVALGDYDRDGFLDIAAANCFGGGQHNALYHNNGNGNSWLTIHCVGTVSNGSAIGSKVKVKAIINGKAIWQYRLIEGQSGYCGQNLEAHFGLGNASTADSIKVEFPSGQTVVLTNVPAKQFLTIKEPMPSGYLRGGFICDSLQGRVPFTVKFYDNSIADSAHPITSWQWDFNNDGIVDATTKNAQFTFVNVDTYTVKLTVSNGTIQSSKIGMKTIIADKVPTPPMIISFFPTLVDTTIPNNGRVNFQINVLDTSGTPVTYAWTKNGALLGSTGNKYVYLSTASFPSPRKDSIKVTTSNDYYSETRTWIVTVNPTAGIKNTLAPLTYGLFQNYPDPFNPSTTIRYALQNRSSVKLVITNTSGQQVAVLESGEREAGYHEVEWRANASSGIYFYRIEATAVDDPNKHFADTKKMLLLR